VTKAKLIVNDKKQLRIQFVNKNNKQVEFAVRSDQLSAQLASLELNQLHGMEVEMDEEGGQPRRIRPVGQPFQAQSSEASKPAAQHADQPRGPSGTRGGQRPTGQQSTQVVGGSRQSMPAFHNPYNFIPAPPRVTKDPDLGDHEPLGHHRFHPDCYTGVIRVRMTTVTPLLLPDAARAVETKNGHKSFPVRLDSKGNPCIAPTSIKGMLRAAYEAVTNSRLAVFPGHDDKLAYRMPTNQGLRLVPARIVDGEIELLMGTSKFSSEGPDGPLYAAWLPRYYKGQISRNAVQYQNGTLPQHGDAVECYIELFQHFRWDRKSARHVPDFQFWQVRDIAKSPQKLGGKPQPTSDSTPKPGQNCWKSLKRIEHVRGYVCITNANIDRKHDERVFFSMMNKPPRVPLSQNLIDDWRMLIANYQAEHEKEIQKGLQGPPALQHSVWSRHVVGINGNKKQQQQLTNETLCYAAVRKLDGNKWQVLALYPVNISRTLFEISPLALLDTTLRPATQLDQLSPADRVFGWVNQEGHGAYRGQFRIGPVTCVQGRAAVEWFTSKKQNVFENDTNQDLGLPLAILGAPKPQQVRFYVAKDASGAAQEEGISKEKAGYSPGKGLRGRKVYPHHNNLPPDYWSNPMEDRTQKANGKFFQEYRRPKLNSQEQRDDQNRSIQGWIRPGAEFTFDIYVTNLSRVELGALLWLLCLPKDYFHRFGGGKPLGFGSVRLTIDWEHTRLYSGQGWRAIYSDLTYGDLNEVELPASSGGGDLQSINAENAKLLVDAFQRAVERAYGNGKTFQQVPFIAAFLRMAQGFTDGLPIHYPRARQQNQQGPVPPHPEGKAYEWFVENERIARDGGGPKLSLPNLHAERGLPIL